MKKEGRGREGKREEEEEGRTWTGKEKEHTDGKKKRKERRE